MRTERLGTHVRRQATRSRGGAYVVILGVSMMVTVIGLSVVTVSRIERRASEGANSEAEARYCAHSAVDLAVLTIKQDANWRTTYTHDAWVADQALGRGTFKWKLLDTVDTDLSNDDSHPVRLVAWGTVGDSTRKVSVLLNPTGDGLTCLEVALHADNDINHTGSAVNGNQIISANNSIDADSGSVILSDVEAVNAVTGSGTYGGTVTTAITPRSMPAASVYDYYLTNGTPILASSLDVFAGNLLIEETLLSPAVNPFGTGQTNPQGIYVIDCQGQNIQIQNCRIVGTLVLLNAGNGSEIGLSIHWEPAVANYPALLVQGNMLFHFTAATGLDEGAPINVNFNPVGTPYQGDQDSDTTDTYPTVIKGLVYVAGDVQTSNDPSFDGVVVVGATASIVNTSLGLTYRSTCFDDPPPGFTAGSAVEVDRSSFKQEVD